MGCANYVFDKLGLDTISSGSVVAFALECLRKGLLSEEELGKSDLKFGDLDTVLYIAELIAKREGIDDLLAEGALKKVMVRIGKGIEEFSKHVERLEANAYALLSPPAGG